MLLPRSSHNVKYTLEVRPGQTSYDSVVVQLQSIATGNKSDVALIKEEVDDLIVMLTYYRREVFGEA